MRITFLLTAITLVGFSLAGGNRAATPVEANLVGPRSATPPAASTLPALQSVTRPGATRFSSAYTALTKCGSGMTKKEEQEAEEHGSDIPTRCKGFGGYDVYVTYSACTSYFSLERGEERIALATQAVDWKQKTVEWRMAHVNGKAKPFAVIMRVYEHAGDQHCSTGGKITSESLMIKGLKGFEHIDEEVKVKGTPNPNAKARQLADQGYAKTRS